MPSTSVDAALVVERVLRRGEGTELVDVGAGGEGLVAGTLQDQHLERAVAIGFSQISASRSYMAKVKALPAWGRLKVTLPTPSWRSNRIWSAALACSVIYAILQLWFVKA